MFIKSQRGWYDRDGGQKASGAFLMVFSVKAGGELRALVRHVKMHQCGHFMMGRVVLKLPGQEEPVQLTLSGTYGGDGLTIGAERTESAPLTEGGEPYVYEEKGHALWDYLTPVPEALTEQFWHPEHSGWNSAGSEGPFMADWARENIKELRRLRNRTSLT